MRVVLILLCFLLAVNGDEDWKAPVINVDVKIGTPAQSLTLQADPNFDDIFVIGDLCKSLGCSNEASNRKAYISSKSTTANVSKILLKKKFGRSIVNGKYVNDVVTLDSVNDVKLDIGVLSSSDVDFYNIQADGIIGLSLKNYYRSDQQLKSVVGSLLSTSIGKQWLTVWINKASSNKNRIGHVTFGALNSKYCKGNPQFYPDSFEYQFYVEKLRFGPITSHRAIDSRVDFQQQYILVPTIEYKQLMKTLSLSEDSKFACSKIKDINLEFKINSVFYVLNYTDYAIQLDATYCKLLLKDNGDYYQTGNGFVLGEPFLRKTCVTFDIQSSSIGFSQSVAQ